MIDFGHGMPAQSIETAVWWEDVAKTYFFKGDRWVCMGPKHCPFICSHIWQLAIITNRSVPELQTLT